MPVSVFGSTRCWRLWLVGKFLLGKVKVDMSRVGLKLAVGVKSLSIVDLLSSDFLMVPHRHNQLFQTGGHLSLFFVSSKHDSVS